MQVLVTGGSGFVGQQVVRELLDQGHAVQALTRPGSADRFTQVEGLKLCSGDVLEPETLAEAVQGCEAVIHLVGIIREFPGRGITFERLHTDATRNMLVAAKAAGVQRFVHMSANGSRPAATTAYHKTKWAAEQLVSASELQWTIFRPSLIYGPGDQFVTMLAGLLRTLPMVPVIGDGHYRMSPVSVRLIAKSFVQALQGPEFVGQIYHCGGPEPLSYNEILDAVGQALGKAKVLKFHQPLLMMKPAVSLLQSLPGFPLTSTQLTMLLEGNEVDPVPWVEAFQLSQEPFLQGIKAYLAQT